MLSSHAKLSPDNPRLVLKRDAEAARCVEDLADWSRCWVLQCQPAY